MGYSIRPAGPLHLGPCFLWMKKQTKQQRMTQRHTEDETASLHPDQNRRNNLQTPFYCYSITVPFTLKKPSTSLQYHHLPWRILPPQIKAQTSHTSSAQCLSSPRNHLNPAEGKGEATGQATTCNLQKQRCDWHTLHMRLPACLPASLPARVLMQGTNNNKHTHPHTLGDGGSAQLVVPASLFTGL